MSGFTLSALHDCWQTLKHDGKIPAECVPLPVQGALKELGLAEVDWFTQDVVLTEIGMVEAELALLSPWDASTTPNLHGDPFSFTQGSARPQTPAAERRESHSTRTCSRLPRSSQACQL